MELRPIEHRRAMLALLPQIEEALKEGDYPKVMSLLDDFRWHLGKVDKRMALIRPQEKKAREESA